MPMLKQWWEALVSWGQRFVTIDSRFHPVLHCSHDPRRRYRSTCMIKHTVFFIAEWLKGLMYSLRMYVQYVPL